MVDPPAAARNFARLAGVGARGRYGFYEALDYTPSRLPEGKTFAIVRAFMAHHQGMTIVAIADALLDGAMRARFHAEPIVQATELLLQERTPRDVAVVRPWAAEAKSAAKIRAIEPPGGRRLTTAHGATPATHLLSNGRYAVMLTAAGSGYSRWRDLAVTRWREDATCDDWGSYVFLRDVRSGDVWSAGFQPSGAEPDGYDVVFNEDRAEFTRRDGTLTTTLEVLVSAEDDAEVRRVSIANSGSRDAGDRGHVLCRARAGAAAADVAHPAFSKLFVETEYLAGYRRHPGDAAATRADGARDLGGASRRRRRRSGGQAGDRDRPGAFPRPRPRRPNADRGDRRAGRSRTRSAPCSIRSSRCAAACGSRPARSCASPSGRWSRRSREALLDLVDKHRDATAFERAATLAWTQAQVQLHHLGIDPGEAGLFQRLAGHLLYAAPDAARRPPTRSGGAAADSRGSGRLGISGDLPIVLLRIADIENLDIARQLLQAHEYWRMKQLAVDLVILNERASSYVQDLQIALEALVRTSQSQSAGRRGAGRGPCLRAAGRSDRRRRHARLLASVARVVLVGQRGASPISSIALPRTPVAKTPIRPASGSLSPMPKPQRAPPPAGARVLQRARRLRRGRPRICDDPRPGPVDAGALDQRHRQSRLRLSGGDRRRRLHLVGQQPREPAHALVERSGHRSSGRGVLSARRRHRRPVEPDGPADPRRGRRPTSPAMAAATAGSSMRRTASLPTSCSTCRSTTRSRSRASCCATRRSRAAASVGHRLCRMGARPVAGGLGAVRDDRDRSRHRRDVRAQSVESGLRLARRLRRSAAGGRSDWTGDRREFIGRNGTLASPAALAGAAPLSNTRRRRSRSVRRVARPWSSCRRTAASRSSSSSVRQPATPRRAALIARYRAADLDAVLSEVAALLGRCPGRGPGEDARPVDGHHAERLAALSDARLPHLGALRRSIRRAAPTAFAISCRTAWRSPPRARR